MKKISILLVALLVLGLASLSYADTPAGDGFEILGQGGQAGLTPGTLVVRVRYGLRGLSNPSLASGDVVIWDTNSSDGLTISACITSNDTTYAGVLTSTIQTADSSTVRRNARNWGTMAVKGFALAKMDGPSTGGQLLVPSAQDGGVPAAFTTADKYIAITSISVYSSMDVGVALATRTASGLAPVWLN